MVCPAAAPRSLVAPPHQGPGSARGGLGGGGHTLVGKPPPGRPGLACPPAPTPSSLVAGGLSRGVQLRKLHQGLRRQRAGGSGLGGGSALNWRPLCLAGSVGGGTGGEGGADLEGGGDDAGVGPPIVPLRVHSDYSLQAGALPGCAQVGDLVQAAADAGLPALALTDHGVMHGAVELLQRCRAAGVKPIIGMDMYVTAAPVGGGAGAGGARVGIYQLTVLARSTEGYRNLVALCTASHLRRGEAEPAAAGGGGAYPVVAAEDLAARRDGLAVLSGSFAWEWGVPGEVPRALAEGRDDDARRAALWFRSVFGADYYVQLEDHGYRGVGGQGGAHDGPLNLALVSLAREIGARCVVASSVHMVAPGDRVALDALSCIHGGRRMGERCAVCTGTEYMRSRADLWSRMRDYLDPEDFRGAVAATRALADAVEAYDILSEPRTPDFPGLPDGEDPDSFLRQLAEDGLRMRLATSRTGREPQPGGASGGDEAAVGEAEYWERLEVELGVLSRCGFSSYFLLVWDLVRFAQESDIPVGPGRGSAAGSLVAWSLQLTAMDPVRHSLLFERFLNEERRSMPDIDTDLCIEGRDRVLRYVAERYGDDRVAQIGTFGRMTSRAVLRDVARVQGRPHAFSDLLSKLVPVVRGKPTPLATMVGAESPSPEFRSRYNGEREVRETVDLAMRLEGVHRSVGVHAAGVVIAPREGGLSGVPLLRNDDGAVVTQYAMEEVEACGLLKMDLLGLRNLTCIARAYALVREHHGVSLPPMERLPEDDAATYALLAAGQLEGVFQLDTSQGMLAVVRGLRPSCLEDIFALLALYRPGPLDAGLIPLYIDRKHGRAPVTYEHPLLEPILRPTYGVLLYQEQIMAVARDLAGYTLGEADLLRRAMGKKKRDEMEAQRAKFCEGAAARGVEPAVAESLFEQMVAFAEYCFNKSHSAAYGLITYTTAYLKANYPVAFMAALLSANRRSPDKLHRCMGAAARMGIRLLPPCANRSGPDFSVEVGGAEGSPGAIRFGLEAVRNVGVGAVGALLEARAAGGPFASLPDLVVRAGAGEGALNSRALEALAGCGALDALHPTGGEEGDVAAGDRRRLMAEVKPVLAWASARRQQGGGGPGAPGRQANLFDALGPGSAAAAVYGAKHSDPSAAYAAHRRGAGRGRGGEAGEPPAPSPPDLPDDERLRLEKDLLGFYVSGHPLAEPLGRVPRWLGHLPVAELAGVRGGEVVAVPALLTAKKTITTRKGARMARVVLEDLTGVIDGVVFPGPFEAVRDHLEAEARLLVWGRLQVQDGGGDGDAGDATGGGDGRRVEMVVSSVQPLTDEAVVLAVRLATADAADPGTRARLRAALRLCTALGREAMVGSGRPGGAVLPVPVVVVVGGDGGAAARVVLLGPAWNVLHVRDAAEVLRGQGLTADVLPLLQPAEEEPPGGLGGLLPPGWAPLPRVATALEAGYLLEPEGTSPPRPSAARAPPGGGAAAPRQKKPNARSPPQLVATATPGGGGGGSTGHRAARYGIQQSGGPGGGLRAPLRSRDSHAAISERIRLSKRRGQGGEGVGRSRGKQGS